MKKINTKDVAEVPKISPKGKFSRVRTLISEALGRKPESMDLLERHPFDVEICRVPPGKHAFPYHSHSAQWEFYHVISGKGTVRHKDGTTVIETGDAFVFGPGEPHQLSNDGAQDLVFYIIADNPVGETCHYPDSKKWVVRSPEMRLMRSDPLDYYDGEE